jgi:hypothetical protein
MRKQLVRWQWEGYPQFHGSRLNLWIHIFTVPAFVLSFFSVLWSLAHLAFISAALSLVGMALAFGAQAFGHKREKNPAIPFDGASDLFSRMFVEQLVTFWRFVFSGGWWRAMRGDKGGAA